MLEQKLREAIQNNDWDTAQKIEALLFSREQRLSLQEARFIERDKLAIEKRLADHQAEKYIAETEKLQRELKFSWAGFLSIVVGIIVSAIGFVKSFFEK